MVGVTVILNAFHTFYPSGKWEDCGTWRVESGEWKVQKLGAQKSGKWKVQSSKVERSRGGYWKVQKFAVSALQRRWAYVKM